MNWIGWGRGGLEGEGGEGRPEGRRGGRRFYVFDACGGLVGGAGCRGGALESQTS